MISFIHKKHIGKASKTSKLVVYYSVSDIILGILLLIFVWFFVASYLHEPTSDQNGNSVASVLNNF